MLEVGALSVLFALSSFTLATASQADGISASAAKYVYLRFEQAFYGADPVLASEWLPSDYQLQQRQFVLEFVEENRNMSRERILVQVEQGAHQQALRASKDTIQVTEQGPEHFCVRARVEGQTEFLGRPVHELSERDVCFANKQNRWQVTSHYIETRYRRVDDNNH